MAESVDGGSETFSSHVANGEGDIPNGAGNSHLPGAGLERGVPALSCLKYCHISGISTEKMHQLG